MNLESGYADKPKNVAVKNLIMIGLCAELANMAIVRIMDFEEGLELTSELTEQNFNIK